MAKKKIESKPDEMAPIRERFEKIADLRNKDFKRYRDDIHFLYVDHWPADVRKDRDNDKRLTLEVDKLLQYQHQVVNDSRMNRPQIKVSPISGGAKEVAEVYDGLIRNIQDKSSADAGYDTALECSTGGGFGFLRLLHEYAHEDTFEQEICIKAVPNPLQVYFGTYKEPDGSDVREVFICEDVPKDEFKEEWPDADPTEWGTEGKYGSWVSAETIRVAERFWIVKKDRALNQLADGSIISDEDYQLAKVNQPDVQMPAIMDQRIIPMNVVMWAKMCGACFLEPEQETVWSGIPVIPVWGNQQNIDGEVRHVSMIHKSKDAQLLYDYSRSAFAEKVGQGPEWVAAVGQTDTYPDEWNGKTRVQVRHYDPTGANGDKLPPPQRTDPSDIPAGFAQDMQLSEHDIQGTLGMYQASLGRQGNATSGVQEREQARKGDVATFHYHDNLARALKVVGTLIVKAVPRVYDSRRVLRTVGMDGSSDEARIDPKSPVPYQEQGKVYNLALGVYGVTVKVGPSYQTQRMEAAAEMAQIATSDPNFMPMYGDLYFKAQDWPMADELAKRAKMLLPPQIQQAEQDDQQSPELKAAMAQSQQAIAQRDQVIHEMQAGAQQAAQEVAVLKQQAASNERDTAIKAGELDIKRREAEIKAYEAETDRKRAEAESAAPLPPVEPAAPATPAQAAQPIHIHPGDSVNEGITLMQQSAAQMTQAVAMLAQIMERMDTRQAATESRPKRKVSKATKQPDGSFLMESTEMQ